MALDDLLKGLAVFQQGMQQYQTAQAVNDANEQMLALNQQQLDKQQQLQAQTQISQGLAMRLGAAGADASKIQALTSEIAPSQGAQYQADVSKEMQGDSQQQQLEVQRRQHAHERAMQQDKIELTLDTKKNERLSKFMVSEANAFHKREKKPIEALDQLAKLADLIESNPSQIGIELGKTALLKDVGEDRISDADVNRAINDPSTRQTIARRLKLEATGEALKNDRTFYAALMKKLRADSVTRLKAKVKGKASALQELYPDVEAEKFESALTKDIPGLAEQVDQKAQEKQKALQAIKDGEALLQQHKNDPIAVEKIKKKINRLKTQYGL